MQFQATTDSDVQLMAMMVAKLLRKEHRIDEAPKPADYEVLETGPHFNRSTEIQVTLAIGRGAKFSVKQHWWSHDDRNLKLMLETASEMAENIAAVHDFREDIMDMSAEVRAATAREIAKAKRRGLPYRLISAIPCPAYDRVRDGIAVDVIFERYSESLRVERATFTAVSAADVVEAFERLRKEQEWRAIRRTQLNVTGATGRIDSVVVNALQEAGYDVAKVLKALVATDDRIVDIGERGDEKTMFCLHWKDGDVYAQLNLGDGTSWHEGRLTFQKTPVALSRAKGRRLREIVDNPIFGETRINSASGKKGEFGSVNCTQDLLNFDADTGRLWAA